MTTSVRVGFAQSTRWKAIATRHGSWRCFPTTVRFRPIYHQCDNRIEAHIFVCFLAYCLHTTLRNLTRGHAAGLTPHAVLEKLSAIQMVDVHLPTTDGRHIVLSRHTDPENDVALLLAPLGLTLPKQPPPKVYASGKVAL